MVISNSYLSVVLNKNVLFNQTELFVTQLLEKDTQRRLGSANDFEDVCKHKFFTAINWNLLNKRMLTPPYVPDLVCSFLRSRRIGPDFHMSARWCIRLL